MNDILQLKGTFQQRPNGGKPGNRNIPKNSNPVTAKHLIKLLENLKQLRKYWTQEKVLAGALIDVHYTKVVAKSNRISSLFSKGQISSNNSVVGARFSDHGQQKKHVITHYVYDEIIGDTIEKLEKSLLLLNDKFGGNIDDVQLRDLANLGINFDKYGFSRSAICSLVPTITTNIRLVEKR